MCGLFFAEEAVRTASSAPRPRRDRIGRTQVKKAKKKEEIRIAREKAEKRIAAALEANNAKQRRKREVFDAKQVEVGTRRPVVPSLH